MSPRPTCRYPTTCLLMSTRVRINKKKISDRCTAFGNPRVISQNHMIFFQWFKINSLYLYISVTVPESQLHTPVPPQYSPKGTVTGNKRKKNGKNMDALCIGQNHLESSGTNPHHWKLRRSYTLAMDCGYIYQHLLYKLYYKETLPYTSNQVSSDILRMSLI